MKSAEHIDPVQPNVFLCYTKKDRILAEKIAMGLFNRGIEVWWDKWEIRAGDSIVQKINEGLGDCTHFIVLLTPRSKDKPWVNDEMNAAFIQRLIGRVKFIPLRCDLQAECLPPLLSSLHSPEISEASLPETLEQLANDIYGITKKPPIGSAPTLIDHPAAPYSPAAMAVADYFCRETNHARKFDPQVTIGALAEATGYSLEDTEDALHELRDLVEHSKEATPPKNKFVWPTSSFWPEFDQYFKYNPNPVEDAQILAARIVNNQEFPKKLPEIAERLGWQPRRINPAVAYLTVRELVRHKLNLGMGDWVVGEIEPTDDTRRFVKSNT